MDGNTVDKNDNSNYDYLPYNFIHTDDDNTKIHNNYDNCRVRVKNIKMMNIITFLIT